MESPIDFNQIQQQISSKRKLDDYYNPNDDDDDDDDNNSISIRMKKDESTDPLKFSESRFASSSNTNSSMEQCTTKRLQFFVRMISGGKTLVIHANSDDSIQSIHQQIQRMTGIPVLEQRLVYRSKQLQLEQTLSQCSIQNDSGLQLVSRMKSTQHPKTWQVINDLVSSICRLCRSEKNPTHWKTVVTSRVKEFLKMTLKNDGQDRSLEHVQIFKSAGAHDALVMLLFSEIDGNADCAEESIKLFLYPNMFTLPREVQNLCAPIVLEFCKLLSGNSKSEVLYICCRNTLGTMLESIGNVHNSKYFKQGQPSHIIHEIFPFVHELGLSLSTILELGTSRYTTSSLDDIRCFGAFLHPLRLAILDQIGGDKHLPMDMQDGSICFVFEIVTLHGIFLNLLGKIDECLKKVEEILVAKGAEEIEKCQLDWSQYLTILKQLNSISMLYQGAEEKFCSVLRLWKLSVNTLARYSNRNDDHTWLLKHKDVTTFECRRHLVTLMLPEVKDDFAELHEMLIDRSDLLSESFEYIAHADSEALRGGLFMEFKSEEATGPGVLREWFCSVSQAIFNPQNPLFLACPNDHRRFFPNPASCMESLHLEYFLFCGRLIALALMHKVQLGVVFDRTFFLQLAGKDVTLEDVQDADPCLYMSCKRILEMDADLLDSDALGLTFVREVEELGSRKVMELCPGGKSISLNSKNRGEYINLLIQHHFVTSVSKQVARFVEGFGDILCNSRDPNSFFQSLELGDLDRMLHGSNTPICIKDWKEHTEYSGYKKSDNQICWFWKIVQGMSVEQQRKLLFFWTSVKYLPVEGFRGLQGKLYIYKASESPDRLPSSHTCFYRLCLPAYQSVDAMHKCLQLITQEHVSCSFGTS